MMAWKYCLENPSWRLDVTTLRLLFHTVSIYGHDPVTLKELATALKESCSAAAKDDFRDFLQQLHAVAARIGALIAD